MIETANLEVDVEQLMQRIRKEVARRKSGATPPPGPVGSHPCPPPRSHAVIQLLKPLPHAAALPQKTHYELRDFLDYHDEAFIVNAYRGVLKRDPDSSGLGIFLSKLRSGDYSKIEILGRLRSSPEGRKAGVRIKGLWFPFVVQTTYRLPLLGYVTSWLNFVLRLPVLIKNLQRFEAYTAYWMHQQQRASAEQINDINGVFGKLQSEIDHLGASQVDNIELDSIREQIRQLIEEKASQRHLTELKNHLHAALDAKASATDLSNLVQTQHHLHAALDAKVNATDLAGIQQQTYEALNAKANTVDLAETRQKLQVLDEAKVEKTELTHLTNHLLSLLQVNTDVVQTKADQTAVTEVHDTLLQAMQTKADQTTVTEMHDTLLQAMQTKADQTAVTEVHDALLQTMQTKADQTAVTEVYDVLVQAVQVKADQAFVATLESEIHQLRQRIQDQKIGLLDNQRRLGLLLEEARKRLPAPLDSAQLVTFANESDHLLDALYVTFEDRFRGDRADIKQRVTVYLPIISAAQVGTPDTPIVDIGCGRGEWLELLKERGLTACGVDLNRIMVNECRERGFEVVEADALQYLRELPEKSLGAVTGMHIIEHLPMAMLVALLDETLRVLRPGGVAIFETPNPENLVVGACNFYMDPTHRNPLPPPMIEYLVEARGFVRVEIRRWQQGLLNPLKLLPTDQVAADVINPLVHMAKEYYFSAPDYAVLGYKA